MLMVLSNLSDTASRLLTEVIIANRKNHGPVGIDGVSFPNGLPKVQVYDFFSKQDVVECDTCGCLIKKSVAMKGESTIYRNPCVQEGITSEESIVSHYFCKKCAPKPKSDMFTDTAFLDNLYRDMLNTTNAITSKPMAFYPEPDKPKMDTISLDDQVKKANRDVLLATAELQRAQAESTKLFNKDKEAGLKHRGIVK